MPRCLQVDRYVCQWSKHPLCRNVLQNKHFKSWKSTEFNSKIQTMCFRQLVLVLKHLKIQHSFWAVQTTFFSYVAYLFSQWQKIWFIDEAILNSWVAWSLNRLHTEPELFDRKDQVGSCLLRGIFWVPGHRLGAKEQEPACRDSASDCFILN